MFKPSKIIKSCIEVLQKVNSAVRSTNYKKTVGIGLCAATLLLNVNGQPAAASSLSKLDLDSVYHVYVDEQRVGTVDNKKVIETFIADKIAENEQKFAEMTFVVGQDIQLIKEVVFTARNTNAATLANLDNVITLKAEATALVVEGKEVSYVKNEDDAEQVVEGLLLNYVSSDDLKKVQEGLVDTNLKVGETEVVGVKLSKEIESLPTTVEPSNIQTVENAIKQLNIGTLEKDTYIVAAGDVLGTIAEAHNLTVNELLALNPSINENSLLQIGKELDVTVYEPVVKVIVEESMKHLENIPFTTEVIEDETMWRGDTKVKQEGQSGQREITYNVVKENGQVVKRHVLNETVLKEAVNKIVLKGTKVTPSRGTGRLAWPAVGGYISSYQGTRWGRFHKGIDIARPSNYNILAADNGTVEFTGWDGGYGNKIIINHNNGIKTLYAHLKSIDVRVGQTVAKGHKIGVMGSTGNSTGIHLHFEVYQNGSLKNPMDFLKK